LEAEAAAVVGAAEGAATEAVVMPAVAAVEAEAVVVVKAAEGAAAEAVVAEAAAADALA
jgi:hypothetical protein